MFQYKFIVLETWIFKMTKNFIFDKSRRDQSNGKSGKLKDINGVNGTPRSIAPGFPDLEDQFNQLGIRHLRFHDNLGFGDLDNYFKPDDDLIMFPLIFYHGTITVIQHQILRIS